MMSIQLYVSNGSRNAVGEMMPVRFATNIVMPVCGRGIGFLRGE